MKKTLIVPLLAALFILSLFLPAVTATNGSNETSQESFGGLSSFINLAWNAEDTQKPIMPMGEHRQIDLTITYGLVSAGGFLNSLFLNLQKGKQVGINLEITEHSPWCTPALTKDNIFTVVSDEDQILSTVLTLRVDEDAPAYEGGFVKIDVSTDDIKGPFGMFTRIKGCEEQYTIELTPGYLPLIRIIATGGTLYEIAPNYETKIPINIENIGNARTTVSAELVDIPENLDASIDEEITLDMNESGQIYFTTKINNDFDEGSVKINCLPQRAEGQTDTGEAASITFIIKNDGSYVVGNNPIAINTAFLVIIVLVSLVIIIAFILKRKKH